jgi:hypothetical protein
MAYMDQARKKLLVTEAKKVLDKWGFKATFSTTRGAINCLLRSGPLDIHSDYNAVKNKSPRPWIRADDDYTPTDYFEVNIYHITSNFSGIVLQFLAALKEALNTGNHDKSDAMSDYFDVGWYIHIQVGAYQKPYIFIPSMAKATKMSKTPSIKQTGDYDVSLFTYDVTTKTFATEASSLGWVVGIKAPKHIMLKGSAKKVLYVRQSLPETCTGPGDVFQYVPTKNSLDWTPACAGTMIKVFNT